MSMAAWVGRLDPGRPQTSSVMGIGEALSDPTLDSSARPGWRQMALAGSLALVLIVVSVLCTPIAAAPMMAIPGFMTAFGTGMAVINFVLAALLLSKGSIEKRADAVRLGAAYFFVACIFVPLLLSFKDGFMPGTLIGKPVSSVWLWCCWHGGFAIMIGWYAINVRRQRDAPSILTLSVAIIGLVIAVTLLTTVGLDYLPGLLVNGQTFFGGSVLSVPALLLTLNGTALLLCLRLRARTTEQLWVTVAMIAACFDVWLTVCGLNRYALGWYLSKCGSFTTSLVVLTSLFHDITRLYRSSAEANARLVALAHVDGLTGAYNRRHFDATLKSEWGRAMRDARPLSLLMLDVDFFKQFNDAYGHLAGDDCLRAVGQRLRECLRRPADVVTRFGGEEFAILLPNTDGTGSLKVAEMLRASVEALQIPHPRSAFGFLSLSIGTSTRVPESDSDPLLLVRLADEALYRAKSEGRNIAVSAH